MEPSRKPCLHRPLNPAVQRCCDARNTILRESGANQPPSLDALDPADPKFSSKKFNLEIRHTEHNSKTQEKAETAFRLAMPDPSTRRGVQDYMACVLHGMTIGAISHNSGRELLSGARIVLTGLRDRHRPSEEKGNTSPHTEDAV
jgi:hypothetical protein